jgi:outer membrane protein
MIWLGALLAIAATPPDTGARAITLAEAIELAQHNSVQAIQAAGVEQTSAATLRSAYAAFLPGISLSAGATRQYPSRGGTRVENGQVITLPSQPWSYSGSIGTNLQLFAGGSRLFDVVQSRAGVAQRFAVALAVKQQFYDVLAARESEGAARAQLEQAEQQFKTASARVRAQTATRSDSLRAEIQLRNAQLAVLDARNSIVSANAGLTRVVGVSYPITAADVSPDVAPLALDEETLSRLSLDGPGVHEAQAQLDAARAARRATWANYLPTLGASYSRSGTGTDSEFGLGASAYDYSGSLRLSLSLPIFNQLQREEQTVRLRVAEENAAAALRDARLMAAQTLAQALGAFRTAAQRVEAQTASVEAAEEDLRVQQQRYAVGNSTLLDVLTSQTQLNQARQDLIQARDDQRVAKAQLEALVGREL